MVVHKKSKHGRGFNHDILPSYFCGVHLPIENISSTKPSPLLRKNKKKIKGEEKALENSRKRAAQAEADKENRAPASELPKLLLEKVSI